jgi:hypothetical protein
MAVKVVYYRAIAKVDLSHNPADEILMVPVNASVEDGNQGAGAALIRSPDLRPVNLAESLLPCYENVAGQIHLSRCSVVGWVTDSSRGDQVSDLAGAGI